MASERTFPPRLEILNFIGLLHGKNSVLTTRSQPGRREKNPQQSLLM